MPARFRFIVLFAMALAPSAYLAWTWRAMPQLGLHHDDALYLVASKSLAEGHGYRIESLPGHPYQTKYPPLVSILLAPLWKHGPGLADNLALAALLMWLMLPACVLLMRALFRQFGLSPFEIWILTFAAAMHPLVCSLATAIMSDLLCLALFTGSMLLAERALASQKPPWMAGVAGLIAGCAFLARAAVLPVLLTAPLCWFFCKPFKKGILFAAGMLPAVAGWQIWSAIHRVRTADPALIFYTDYLALQRSTVHLDNLPRVLWYNTDALLRSIGKLVAFDTAIVESTNFERIIGLAAIVGAIRLIRRSGRLQYPAAAAAIALMLLGYHYTPDGRLSLALSPFALMGFWTEAKHFWSVVAASWRTRVTGNRIAAAAAGLALFCLFVFVVAGYAVGDAVFLPRLYAACRRDLDARRPAYEWLRTHTPPGATVYAYDDPLLYLYTGREAMGLTMPSARIYHAHPEKEAAQFMMAVPENARRRGLDYLLLTAGDFYRESEHGRTHGLMAAAARDPRLVREFSAGGAAVFRCLPP